MKRTWMLISATFLAFVASAAKDEAQPNWAQFPARQGDAAASIEAPEALQAKATVMKVVPHLSANETWKSTLLIRSDATYYIEVVFEFYDPEGRSTNVVFFDSTDERYEGEGFRFGLQPYEIYSIDFDHVTSGWASLQVFAYSTDSDRFYSIESIFNRYDEQSRKTAAVGVPTEAPYERFIMNMDERFDAYSGYQKFRGFALTNTTDDTCRCDIFLYDDGKAGENLEGHLGQVQITLGPRAKWVGYIIDLYPDIDDLLRDGFGYIDVMCSRPVNALGLAFEVDSPVAASVPIDPLQ